ncbi:MAG: branched-chain amino acid ABC transporter permease [Pseudomonadota bacterium]|nr:branched-chain amino acid ABC transporter permease [Pseudomonadota bacterium]
MELLQITLEGTLTGLLYGLVALAFVVIFRASRIVNLAQGQLVLVGAYVMGTLLASLPLPVAIALALAASLLIGVVIERLVFRPLIGQPVFSIVMASIGLLILLQGAVQLIWGAQTRPFAQIFPEGTWKLDGLLINKRLLSGAVITLVAVEALRLFFMKTRIGLRLAAVAEDHFVALSLGVSVEASTRIAWAAGAFVSTLAAMILLSGNVLGLQAGDIGLRALPVALLGGLESLRGAVLAGVLVGVGEALAAHYLDPLTGGAMSLVFPFMLMIAVLLVRPQGLFGWKVIERL